MLLSPIVFLPLLAALGLAFAPPGERWIPRAVALAVTGVVAALAAVLFWQFTPGLPGYQFDTLVPGLGAASIGIRCRLAVDGLSVGLVFMGALVAVCAVWVSDDVREREKEFYVLLLLMTGGILGAFASVDLFFFYFFHELALVPTFIMIGVWGRGEDRGYAAYKITLYLSLGALIALVGLVALYLESGARTFDMERMTEHVVRNPIESAAQGRVFGWLMFGFGILVSLWPFHTWAPLGYGAAPPATAMIHAGVLKKFGLYGLIRIGLPMVPEGARAWFDVLVLLALGNILYCGWVAMRQRQMNLLIANSSVAHMGFVFLGIASFTIAGVTGAVVVMIAHGLLAALTFALSGYLLRQTGTLDTLKLGGLLARLPFIGTALIMALLAGCGLPGFANFAGEAMVFFGAWKAFPVHTALACWGALVIGGVYMIHAIRDVLHGPPNPQWNAVVDAVAPLARAPFVLLLGALLLFGFFPRLLTERIQPSIRVTLDPPLASVPATEPSAGGARVAQVGETEGELWGRP